MEFEESKPIFFQIFMEFEFQGNKSEKLKNQKFQPDSMDNLSIRPLGVGEGGEHGLQCELTIVVEFLHRCVPMNTSN